MHGNNFFNPYMFTPRYTSIMNASNIGKATNINKNFFTNLFHKFNLNNFLTGASKTLSVVNQAIPIYYQVKPMINNAKTMFRVMSAVKSDEESNKNLNKTSNQVKREKNSSHSHNHDINDTNLTFFL